MKMRHSLLCSGLLALLLASPKAQAQLSNDLIMESYNSNISAITNGAINKSVMESTMERDNAGRSGAATRRSASASTAYTPTAALRQQTVQGYVNRLKTSNPTGAQAVASAFGPGKYEYGQVYGEILKGTGLRENDAADALACYMLLGWAVVNNVQNDEAITIPMAQGVRAQVAPLLAGSAQMRTRAAQVGEELKLQTVVVQGGWQAAIKESKLAAYQQGISNLFKTQYGMNMSQFKLASQGFGK